MLQLVCRDRPTLVTHPGNEARPPVITQPPPPGEHVIERSRGNLRIDTHRVPVQSATADVLAALAPGDLLFVDSSHVHKPGSDVETVFDVLIPGVPEGVFVHLHDIYTPYRYPRAWYSEAKRFWNEGEHLEDFLRFNDAFEVVLPVQMLIRQSSLLRDRWQREGRGPLEGSSFYLRRVSPPC